SKTSNLTSGVTKTPKIQHSTSAKTVYCFECSTSGGSHNQPICASVSELVAHDQRTVASPFGTLSCSRIAGELGGGEGVRTPDLRLAKPALCQTELRPLLKLSRRLVAGAGFEPATFGL